VAGGSAQRGGQAHDERGVQARGVGGGEIFRAQNRRPGRNRHTGFGQPAQLGDHPVADVAQVGDAFGHQATHLREQVDELGHCVGGGAHRRRALPDPFFRRTQPRAILSQHRGRRQHLRGGARRTGGTCPQSVGDGGCG
jgi:hypothetical protein